MARSYDRRQPRPRKEFKLLAKDLNTGSTASTEALMPDGVPAGVAPLRAGAARVEIAPDSPVPMIGFVRRQTPAQGEGTLPLEATALVVERDDTRLVLCGVDTLGLSVERSDRIRARIAEAISTDRAAVVLNWNHTHCAPPGGNELLRASGLLTIDGDDEIDAYAELLEQRLLELVATAASRLEPASVTWGIGSADISINRREPDETGRVVQGWRPDGLVDQQVVALRAERPDGTPIATVVNFGCHTTAVGMDFPSYSSDYPGALRIALRQFGGEVVFLQGGGGNVSPRASFCKDEAEAVAMGRRLAVETLHALADRPAWPSRWIRDGDGSLMPMILYRREPIEAPEMKLAASERRLRLPLQDAPSEQELAGESERLEHEVAEARNRGAGDAELYGLLYHAKWARQTLAAVRGGTAPTHVEAPMQALRIGDGVIVTTPGELFTEIGWAIKERSPALPTMVLGFTNGAVGYLPTAESYAEGGYEPAFSNRSYGAPATVRPEVAELLTKTGVRMAEELFPDRPAFAGDDWTPRGSLPELAREAPRKPSADEYEVPVTAPAPG